MKFFITITLLSLITLSHAKSYDLKLNLSLSGKTIGSPHLIVKENEKAFFESVRDEQQTIIEVIVKDVTALNASKKSKLEFKVKYIELENNRKIEITPTIIVKDNSPASITTTTETGEEIALTITSTELNTTN